MNSESPASRPASAGFVRLCVALLVATLALVALGGLVRVTGSGLGCPDWPLCHGRLIPPFELAPWIEYMHRLAAATVSVLVVAFAVSTWWGYRDRPWLVVPGTLAPLLLIVQIYLGRLTVLNEIPPTIAWIHTAVAMAILAVVVVPVCAAYSPLRAASADAAQQISEPARATRLAALLGLASLVVYLLLLTGAYVTRSGAAGACPALPLCGGVGGAGTPAGRLQDIHMLHRIVAAGAALVVAFALVDAWRTALPALQVARRRYCARARPATLPGRGQRCLSPAAVVARSAPGYRGTLVGRCGYADHCNLAGCAADGAVASFGGGRPPCLKPDWQTCAWKSAVGAGVKSATCGRRCAGAECWPAPGRPAASRPPGQPAGPPALPTLAAARSRRAAT